MQYFVYFNPCSVVIFLKIAFFPFQLTSPRTRYSIISSSRLHIVTLMPPNHHRNHKYIALHNKRKDIKEITVMYFHLFPKIKTAGKGLINTIKKLTVYFQSAYTVKKNPCKITGRKRQQRFQPYPVKKNDHAHHFMQPVMLIDELKLKMRGLP